MVENEVSGSFGSPTIPMDSDIWGDYIVCMSFCVETKKTRSTKL